VHYSTPGQSNRESAQRLEQLRQGVRHFTKSDRETSAPFPGSGMDRDSEEEDFPQMTGPVEPPAEVIQQTPAFYPGTRKLPCAFWERSNLSRFPLRILR
jgi:hypothetical protein